jgi:hypothetical protein
MYKQKSEKIRRLTSMKRFIVILLAMLICIPNIYARKTRALSGKIENNVYTDSKYGFSIKLLENWERKLQKPKSNLRLDMKQKEHKIPPELENYPNMVQIPRLEIFIFDEKMRPDAYVDSLTSETFKSKSKKEILKEIIVVEENLVFDGFKKAQMDAIRVNDKAAVQWAGSVNFTKKLSMVDSTPRSYGVGFIVVSNGEQIIVFSLYCEQAFLSDIFSEVYKMAESLEWTK